MRPVESLDIVVFSRAAAARLRRIEPGNAAITAWEALAGCGGNPVEGSDLHAFGQVIRAGLAAAFRVLETEQDGAEAAAVILRQPPAAKPKAKAKAPAPAPTPKAKGRR